MKWPILVKIEANGLDEVFSDDFPVFYGSNYP